MHINFLKVTQVGKKATVIAIIGTFLPFIAGLVVVGLLFDNEYYPSGFVRRRWRRRTSGAIEAARSQPTLAPSLSGVRRVARQAAGCAFAPTSVGISINLLEESKMLGSIAGDDTVFLAAASPNAATRLARSLRRLAGITAS